MLRNEKPLNLRYWYDGLEHDPTQSFRNLTSIRLFTGLEEPLGEGPEDFRARAKKLGSAAGEAQQQPKAKDAPASSKSP